MKRDAKREEKKCAIPACWQPATSGGMCNACRSWWWRVQLYTPGQLSTYVRRLDRFASRAGRLGGLRRRSKAA
jgi:hypothetical protein